MVAKERGVQMSISWINLIFGWPPLLLAIIVTLIGIYKSRPIMPTVSALISTPHAVYLGLTPLFGYFGFGLPIFHLLAGYALKKQKEKAAILLLLPFVLYTIWLLIVVTNQTSPNAS
jgi:hypothetical protein